MKKNHGFIFIALGIILLLVGFVFNFTNLFSKKDSQDPSPSPTTTPVPLKKDYVKSHDIEKKTKVSFPILNNLEVNKLYVGEFSKEYYDNDNAIYYRVDIIETKKSVEEYSKYDQDLMLNKSAEFNVTNEDIKCQYLCKKYQVSKNDETIQIVLYVYIKTSDNDLAVISYKGPADNKANDVIDTIIKNISVTNDATYTIGKANNGFIDLGFTTDNNKELTLTLDGGIYEEVADGFNTKKETRVKNINTNQVIVLKTHVKEDNQTINEYVDRYYNLEKPGSNRKDISIEGKEIYEYILTGIKGYAVIIDEETALLIMSESSVNVNDFININ